VSSHSLRSQRPEHGTEGTKHGEALIVLRLEIVTENVAADLIQVCEQFPERLLSASRNHGWS
jgi:hypothetical protein